MYFCVLKKFPRCPCCHSRRRVDPECSQYDPFPISPSILPHALKSIPPRPLQKQGRIFQTGGSARCKWINTKNINMNQDLVWENVKETLEWISHSHSTHFSTLNNESVVSFQLRSSRCRGTCVYSVHLLPFRDNHKFPQISIPISKSALLKMSNAVCSAKSLRALVYGLQGPRCRVSFPAKFTGILVQLL